MKQQDLINRIHDDIRALSEMDKRLDNEFDFDCNLNDLIFLADVLYNDVSNLEHLSDWRRNTYA